MGFGGLVGLGGRERGFGKRFIHICNYIYNISHVLIFFFELVYVSVQILYPAPTPKTPPPPPPVRSPDFEYGLDVLGLRGGGLEGKG